MTNEDLDEVLEETAEVVEATEELIEPLAKAGAGDEVAALVEKTDELVDSVADLHGAERDGRENETPTTTVDIPAGGRTNVERRKEGKTNDTTEVPARGSGRETYTEEVPIQGGDVDDPDTVTVERSKPNQERIMNTMLPGWRNPTLQEARRKAEAERKQRRKNQRERRERMAREAAGSHHMNAAYEDDVDDDLDIPAGGRTNVERRREENDEDA